MLIAPAVTPPVAPADSATPNLTSMSSDPAGHTMAPGTTAMPGMIAMPGRPTNGGRSDDG